MRENKKREKMYEVVNTQELFRLAKSGDMKATEELLNDQINIFKEECQHLISIPQFEIIYENVAKKQCQYLITEDFYWQWRQLNKRNSELVREILFRLMMICKEEKNRELAFMKRMITKIQTDLEELESIFLFSLGLAFEKSTEYEEMLVIVWRFFREELNHCINDSAKQLSLNHIEIEAKPFEDPLLNQIVSQEKLVCENHKISPFYMKRTFFIVRACLV